MIGTPPCTVQSVRLPGITASNVFRATSKRRNALQVELHDGVSEYVNAGDKGAGQ